MRIGLIGYGSIGARHARLLKKHVKQIVILSKRKDVPEPFVTVHDWKALEAYGPFDALFITNETGKRRDTITRSLKLSTNALFVEKPLAMNARDAAAIARAIHSKRMSAWVGYCLHWYEPILRAQQIVARGGLGTIHSMRAFVGQDLRTWRERDYRKSYSSNAKQGGGVLLDLIHEINYPAWILGEQIEPLSARVSRSKKLKTDAETSADSVSVTPSGTVVQIHQDCERNPGLRSLEIAGEKGSLAWDSQSGTLTVKTVRGTKKEKIHMERDEMYERQLAHFFRALKRGKPFSNLDEAVQDLRVVDRIRALAKG